MKEEEGPHRGSSLPPVPGPPCSAAQGWGNIEARPRLTSQRLRAKQEGPRGRQASSGSTGQSPGASTPQLTVAGDSTGPRCVAVPPPPPELLGGRPPELLLQHPGRPCLTAPAGTGKAGVCLQGGLLGTEGRPQTSDPTEASLPCHKEPPKPTDPTVSLREAARAPGDWVPTAV